MSPDNNALGVNFTEQRLQRPTLNWGEYAITEVQARSRGTVA
jgi:hypothetical protein